VIDIIQDWLNIAQSRQKKLCGFKEKDMGTAGWGHGLSKG
jgi:hypothetical protein